MKIVSLVVLLMATLCFADDANTYYVDQSTVKKTTYKWTMNVNNHKYSQTSPEMTADNPELKVGWVEFESFDENILHFKMNDKYGSRWEMPLFNSDARKDLKPAAMDKMKLEIKNDPFTFSITSPQTGEELVNTALNKFGALKYYDKYIEMGLWYNTNQIYGLGERVTESFRLCTKHPTCTYTMFNRDQTSPFDDGEGHGGKNIYGSQPFYMVQTKKKSFFGVLWLNSNDQDIVFVHRDGGEANLYHKTIGGIIDMYFFYTGSAEMIMKKYHTFIGKPYLPPFWTLGFHLCRYGWKDLKKVESVVANMESHDIPLEVLWADIDYMKEYADFTIDPDRYGGMGEFVKETLHKRKMHWVPIIDAGLKYDVNDPYYKKGEAKGSFIKSAWTKKTLIGKVWPGLAVFPDWYHPYMKELWHEGLSNLFKMAEFDGIWIDMNECSNFCDGECPNGDMQAEKTRMLRESANNHDPHEFDDLPYYPGWVDPAKSTLSMTGYHHSNNEYEEKFYKEYNVHNLFSYYEAVATHEFFTEKQHKRPFVLTRAQVPGSGKYTSLWLGDNYSKWEYMRASIPGIYNYQMFGMPLVGADMCGFLHETNEELCLRWMQMGAFYTFTRNHNDIHSGDQEPYVFGEKVAKASRNAIRQKYSILWYYYTKMYEASLNGGSVIRPMFWEFPEDEKVYEKTESTWMIGSALLVAPVLYPNSMMTYPYVTNEHWYDMFWRVQQYAYVQGAKEGKQLELPGGYEWVTVLMRGGSIVPFQDAVKAKVRRTSMLKIIPIELMIGPDHNGNAEGTLAFDYEDSLHAIEKGEYRHLSLKFSMSKKLLEVKVLHDYSMYYQCEKADKVTILGASEMSAVKKFCLVTKEGEKLEGRCSYHAQQKALYCDLESNHFYWSQVDHVSYDQGC